MKIDLFKNLIGKKVINLKGEIGTIDDIFINIKVQYENRTTFYNENAFDEKFLKLIDENEQNKLVNVLETFDKEAEDAKDFEKLLDSFAKFDSQYNFKEDGNHSIANGKANDEKKDTTKNKSYFIVIHDDNYKKTKCFGVLEIMKTFKIQ